MSADMYKIWSYTFLAFYNDDAFILTENRQTADNPVFKKPVKSALTVTIVNTHFSPEKYN